METIKINKVIKWRERKIIEENEEQIRGGIKYLNANNKKKI